MRKEDLKLGNVIETRYTLRYLKCYNGKYYNLNGCGCFELDNSTETLESLVCKENDIMKVYEDYTCQKVLWERKEKIKLTEDEKVILRNLSKKYKWIAKDSTETLYVYTDKPKKKSMYWYSANFLDLTGFEHLFKFITWEDEEPYLISDLLGED